MQISLRLIVTPVAIVYSYTMKKPENLPRRGAGIAVRRGSASGDDRSSAERDRSMSGPAETGAVRGKRGLFKKERGRSFPA